MNPLKGFTLPRTPGGTSSLAPTPPWYYVAKRLVGKRAATLLAGLALAGSALAQQFPAKPVTIMVPYPAGALSDAIARTVATPLSRILKQPVLVENLGGAGGSIGAQKVLNAAADGYYILQGSPNELILTSLANAAVKLKSDDFRLVQMIANAPLAVLARSDLPAGNSDELVAYAAKAAREGKPLTYGSVGHGTLYHLMGAKMSKMTGIPMTHVPYKGGSPLMQDMVGGVVDIAIIPLGKPQIELAQQGRLKIVTTLTHTRLDSTKHVPTVQEGKALKDLVYSLWTGYFVKKDTPEPIVQALHKALSELLADSEIRKSLEAQSLEVSRTLTLVEASQAYTDGTAQMRAVAKSINLQPQ
jgi:tripartite-type tricarboxylate transporter receptor subunit TctC